MDLCCLSSNAKVETLYLPLNLCSNLHLWLWGLAIDRREGGAVDIQKSSDWICWFFELKDIDSVGVVHFFLLQWWYTKLLELIVSPLGSIQVLHVLTHRPINQSDFILRARFILIQSALQTTDKLITVQMQAVNDLRRIHTRNKNDKTNLQLDQRPTATEQDPTRPD